MSGVGVEGPTSDVEGLRSEVEGRRAKGEGRRGVAGKARFAARARRRHVFAFACGFAPVPAGLSAATGASGGTPSSCSEPLITDENTGPATVPP